MAQPRRLAEEWWIDSQGLAESVRIPILEDKMIFEGHVDDVIAVPHVVASLLVAVVVASRTSSRAGRLPAPPLPTARDEDEQVADHPGPWGRGASVPLQRNMTAWSTINIAASRARGIPGCSSSPSPV